MRITDAGTNPERYFIQGYGPGRFRLSGEDHHGSLLVTPDDVIAWSVGAVAQLTLASLAPLLDRTEPPELLLLGCGERIEFPAREVRAGLKERGIALELMDTGAACRTFNILMAEDRRVAAALIALSE